MKFFHSFIVFLEPKFKLFLKLFSLFIGALFDVIEFLLHFFDYLFFGAYLNL